MPGSEPEGNLDAVRGGLRRHRLEQLGDLAVSRGLITAGQRDEWLEAEADARGLLLVRRGWISEPQLRELREDVRRRGLGPAAFERLGRFELLEKIGEGAAALIYRAQDPRVGRDVAVKVLRPEFSFDAEVRERFRREGEVLARLSHPHILKIHDVGEEESRPYLVTELLEGRTLENVLSQGKTPLPALVTILEKVARGVHHAHEHRIVHRDLKPGNILLTPDGEPRILDFGIAHLMEHDQRMTRTGAPLGTPIYMSPEQLQNRPGTVTARTDVYALGAILYECLAGRPPHAARATAELQRMILEEDPPLPRSLRPTAPEDLGAVALKALERSPSRRFGSAAELADELRRFLTGRPVRTRPAGAIRRLGRRLRRHRRAVAAVALALTVAVAAVWMSAAHHNRRQLEQTLGTAEEFERRSMIEEAYGAYQIALGLDRSDARARDGAARVEAILGRKRVREEELRARAEKVEKAQKLLEVGRQALEGALDFLYEEQATFEELERHLDRGQAAVEEAILLAPHLALGRFYRGRMLELRGCEPDAEAEYRQAAGLDPKFGPARFYLGRLLYVRAFLAMLGPGAEGADEAQRSPDAPGIAEEARREILASIETGHGFDDAIDRQFALGMVALTRGDYASARSIAGAAIERFGTRRRVEEFYWLLGVTEGTEEARLAALDHALELRPHFPLSRFCRAVRRRAKGDVRGAIEDYDQAIRMHPRFDKAFYNRGNARKKLGDFAGAIEDYTRAIELDPTYPEPFVNRGNARLARSDYATAIEDFARALDLAPDRPDALLGRGLARRHTGDSDGALRDLSAALKAAPPEWPGRRKIEDELDLLRRGERD